MRCGKCGSCDSVKAGFNHGKQRYKCKHCGRQYTQTHGKNARSRAEALYFFAIGLSMNAIARRLKVEPSTVLYWARNFALRFYEKPVPEGIVSIELDEVRHFVGKKKPKPGSGWHIAALPCNGLARNAGAEALRPWEKRSVV